MNYIKAWQALPEHGVTYFIVKMTNKIKESKKEVRLEHHRFFISFSVKFFFGSQELFGISPNRLMLMDLQSGDSLKTWRFADIDTWSVNWEIKQVQVTIAREQLSFQCLTADCKVVHEFIGGYMFLAMRSGDKSQALNQEMFHKLTGGRD